MKSNATDHTMKRILILMFGSLAALSLASIAWQLGTGEDVLGGLPSWIGLLIVALASWWLSRTLIDFTRRSQADDSIEPPDERLATQASIVTVLVVVFLFALGWIIGR